MKRVFKQFRHGERGFTLIELLVVVAILGVMAAVIVPNVGRFIGSGTVEAANTETHNVQTAVLAYMADNGLSTLPAASSVGPATDIGPVTGGTTSVKSFMTGNLQATYTINENGEIIEPVTPESTGKWKDLEWSAAEGWYKP